MTDDEPTTGTDKKKLAAYGGGAAGVLGALAAVITAVHGSHSTTTTHDTSKDPVVINRPTDASGKKVPIHVIQPSNGSRPIVIVGADGPTPCPKVTPAPNTLRYYSHKHNLCLPPKHHK